MTNKRQRARNLAEAASWHLRVAEADFCQKDYERWLEWIATDPAHASAFDDVVKLSNRLRDGSAELSGLAIPDQDELKADMYDPKLSVTEWRESRSQRVPRAYGSWRYWAAAAASLVIAAAATLFAFKQLGEPGAGDTVDSYVTTASQHESVALPDGSRIEIGAESTVAVSYNREGRTAILESGEAFFVVARNDDRPFRVLAGQGTITAIGTEFNVRRDSDRVLVTVSEGVVTVRPRGSGSGLAIGNAGTPAAATLGVGQQVAYDAAGLTDVVVVDPSIATSWKQRRLQYLREPLRFVIAGVNRYSEIEIVIADSALEELTFTGTVYDGQTGEWLQGLSEVLPIEVEYVGNSTALLRRAD